MSQEKSFKSKLWEFFKVSGKPLCFPSHYWLSWGYYSG